MTVLFTGWMPSCRVVSSEIPVNFLRNFSGKITALFRNNSAKNRKFHETLMQLQHSNALYALIIALLSLLAYLL